MRPHSNKRVWTKDEIEFFKRNYFKMTNQELADALKVSKGTVIRFSRELGLFKRPTEKAIEKAYGKSVKEVLTEMHIDNKMSVNEISKELNLARKSIYRLMEKEGVPTRNMSEAQKIIWDGRTKEERANQVKAAHKKMKELANQGKHPFQLKWKKDRERMLEICRENALSMVKNRKYNWMKGRTGVRHPNWNPNRTKEYRIKFRKTEESYAWVRDVYERDGYTCQICGDSKGGNLNAHHIFNYADYEEYRLDVNNGVTLCVDCHKLFHSKYGYGNNDVTQFREFVQTVSLNFLREPVKSLF